MAQSPKMTWPKTLDGTTDWESVFENPETGFIALVSQVQSAVALKLGATVVIKKLFTREVDSAECTRLIKQLDDIIVQGGTDLAATIKGVADLLRTIKDIRIKKAKTYTQRQKAGAAIDRRVGLLWKIDLLLKPAVLFPVGGLFVAALAGLMFLLLQATLGPATKQTPKLTPRVVKQPISQKASPATSPPSKKVATAPPPKKVATASPSKKVATASPSKKVATALSPKKSATSLSPKKKVVPSVPLTPILLKTFRWPFLARNAAVPPQYYAVVLYVKKRKDSRLVCQRVPEVLDTIYQSFNAVMSVRHPVQKAELSQLQNSVKRAINTLLSTSLIIAVDVARYGEKKYRVTVVPPYCKLTKEPSKEKTPKKKKE